MDYIEFVFQSVWILSFLFVRCRRHIYVFHVTFSFMALLCVLNVFACDVETPSLNQEYLLKQHKVIEAVPKVLNREHSEQISTALVPSNTNAKVSLDPCSEQKSYEAIRQLHRQLDDDADGIIDVAESDEFIRDELQSENVYERHREFHENDEYINVDELWEVWTISEVHNWTVQETAEWLVTHVELPQYEHTFRNNGVDGTCLPRMAINSNSLLSVKLGIRDPIHRQKIALKAMDVVLFGAPLSHNYWKDAILALSLIVAIGGCWFAYVQHRYAQTHIHRMMKDMEALQKAEKSLSTMQEQLNKAKEAQEIVTSEKEDLERRLLDEMKVSTKHSHSEHSKSVSNANTSSRIHELEEQLRLVKNNLMEAERRLDSEPWIGPPSLQHWLQLTHELEVRNYNAKKTIAEQQLQAAKEGCEKLRKKRTSFMGTFRIAHGASIDDVDDRIMQAKTALCEVTKDLQERMHRWKQIEKYCGFPIVQNPGITYLESILKPPIMNGAAGLPTLTRSSSEGNLIRDEQPPPYAADIGAGAMGNIPPPKYSKASPLYGRKTGSEMAKITAQTHSPATIPRSVSNTHCLDTMYQDIHDAPIEDEQLVDAEEERCDTPQSCSSYSGYSESGRSPLGDSFDFSYSSQQMGGTAKHDPDFQNSVPEHLRESGKSTSETMLDDKKKKKISSNFAAVFRGNFSTSNLTKHDDTSPDSTCSSKKRKLFSTLRKKEKRL